MAEIAKLVDVLSSADDLSRTLRTDSSLNLGFQKLCSILRQAVEPTVNDENKLGLQLWDQSQIQAVASVALAVFNSTRSLSVERVEPVIAASIQLTVEFALCYLEKSICNSDDSVLQSYILQLLEIALVDETDKELDLSQPCSSNVSMDTLPIAVTEDGVSKWQDDTRCMLQGGRCSKEEKTADSLLMTLASEWMHPDSGNTATIGQPVPCDRNKLIDLSQHWALVHLECVHRLVTVCKSLLSLPVPFDEKFPFPNLRKKFSFCVKVFKLLDSLTKNSSYAHFDPKLFQSVASFTEVLPTLFSLGFDFVSGNPAVESGFESQVMLLLEEFIQLVQSIFCNTHVFQNIQACIAAAILDHLDPNLWKYSKSAAANLKPPLAYCPRVVVYVLKLILDVRNRTYQLFEYKGLDGEGASASQLVEPPSCQVHSVKVNLLKKYTAEELLRIIFSPSVQWVDSIMQLLLFLHSEGVKLKPKLERSCSSVTKTSVTSESESTACHEDEALFGNLFSEGGRSAGSVDGYDQPAVPPSANISNMPIQAATELLSFLNDCIFSHEWCGPVYEDGCRNFTSYHIDILLSILGSEGCDAEERGDDGIAVNEQMKVSHRRLGEICLDLFHNLLSRHALSDLVGESLVEKILVIENGAFVYNDLTLGLLAHAVVCLVDSAGSNLRTKIYNIFADFMREKAKTICSECPNLKEFLEILPSLFHIEILLMAFHLSSEDEKAVQANLVFSTLKAVAVPSDGFDSTQLSCWALLISRLIVMLRHMVFYPRVCPSSLLLEFRTKLREAASSRLRPRVSGSHASSWVSILFEGVVGGSIKETPFYSALLSHLIDITPLPPSTCKDDPTIACLGLSWDDIHASFSRILRFWEGKKPEKVEDLILERYIFVLCWDQPVLKSTSEHLHLWLTSAEVPELSNAEHFVCFSQSIVGEIGKINYRPFSLVLLGLIHRLHDLHVPEDVRELGWDFLRAGSWLSLSLSLLTAGATGHCMNKSLASAVPMSPEQTSRDGKFCAFTEGVLSTLVGANQVEQLIRVLSALLKRYLEVYEKTLIATIDSDQLLANRLSPAMSFVHTGFDKCKQDELLEKIGSDPCQYKSLYGTLSSLDTTLDKLSLGGHSKVLWESLLHGFPCHLQPPSGILLSSIFNVAGVVNCIDGLMKVIDAGGIACLESQAISQILELVCRIKCDRIFEDLHGKCNDIYQRLTEGSGGLDYSSLFILKNMEEFLRCVNERDGGDTSGIYEVLVVKVIDIVDSLKREPSRIGVLKYFLSLEDVSKQIKDLYGSQRGDLLVLVDALDRCNSEQINIRVLNFFVDLLSEDSYAHVKEKLQKKFLHMDMVYLSKWLETRLLGSESNGVACAKGASVSLRESAMNFITCLLSPSSEILSQELHKHLVKSMLISLDKAFLLFDFTVAKCYFNFLVQLSGGENLIKQLMQQTMLLTEKLAGDENMLQGLKYLFGFLASVLSDCCSAKSATERSFVKSISNSSSGMGSTSTRSVGSRKNADALVLSASQGGSASIECDATSVDEDEDDGTSDGENGSLDKDDEEDNNSERALASKVCTFTSSGSNFMEQHWYFCYTCDLTVSKGCCSVCAKVCHRGHRVVYSRSSRFFCDCGAGGVRGSSCQCLKPRKFAGSNNTASRGASNFQSFLPFTENGDQLPDSDSDIDEDVLVGTDNSVKMSIPKDLQDGMPVLLNELDLESCVVRLCSSFVPSITSRRDSSLSRERKIFLGDEKVLCNSVDLLQLKKAYKSGSLDLKIKADYSNAKELKSHLASGSLVKSLLSVSTRGRLAVGEGDKVAIFDVGQLIGQATVAPVTADKTNVKPLSKNVVRFEIVNLIFNPLVENYLAVAGYEDCQVLTVNHRGEVSDRLAIELALQGAYVKRVDWVPGSQVQLMVVTNKFVKIYDLSLDNISPVHYFTLPDDMIMDAALIMASQGRMFLIVLSEHGSLYRLELSTKGNVGAKPLKEILQVEGKERDAKGSSLYFSLMHRLLFLSFQDGTTLVGRVNPDATSLIEVSAILENETDGKLRPAGLHRWRDLFGGSALLGCFSCLNSNAACAVSFGEHEVLVQNLRNSAGSTSPVVGVAAYKPLSKDKIHCLVLHEDGSLQIYSHVPTGGDSDVSAISDKVKKLGPGILNNKAYGGAKPEFPLDFFERAACITQDVKLSSDAIRSGDFEVAKQTLASEDGFLESPSPGGFKITVSNSNPDLVMVGLRLHVGNTSANHIPSEITVFQRGIKLDEGMRSWYDVPFTVAESLLADEEFTISVGPTFSGSALPRIDSLEIYGRAKDEFGWKEKMDAVLDMEARVLGCNSSPAGSRRKCRATESASLQEQVVAAGLKLLSRIYSLCKPQGCSKAEEAKGELRKLKCKPLLEIVFESDREPLLQAAANRVLQAVFPKREIYYQVKDAIRLAGVVKSTAILSLKLGIDGTTAGWIVEEFTAQMRVVSKIALHRRSNLASFLEMNGSEVVDGLMQVLWGILDIEQPDTQTMNNIVVSSVELIYCYAECLALHGKDGGRSSVAPAVSMFKKLLFSTNEAVQTSSSLAISSRLLQVPFPKQTMIGTDDVENPSSVPSRVDASAGASGSTQVMVEEDSITSSVQYCCDGCSTVPILRRRWHCTVCPDFDLCEACYEILDADRLPPPHSRDHPMTAIPIEVETFGGEGSEIHFTTDELSDSGLLTVASDVVVQSSAPSIHELEPNESEEFSASILDPVTISASKRAVNSLLLSELLEQLKEWMETTSGTGAIPVMQLFYRLSSAVGGPFADGSEPQSIGLETLIKWFLEEINLNKPFISRSRTSFGEVTILVFMFFTLMLRNWHQPGTDGSSTKSGGVTEAHDKTALHISTPTCVTASSTLDGQEKIDFISHLLRACGYLRQQAFVNYLMNILQELTQVFKSPAVSTDPSSGLNTTSGCGALLTIRREVPAGNFSPFFSDSYAKSHRADIFVDYHRLLLENTFRLLYSLIRPEKHDKAGEKEKLYKMPSGKDLKLDGYQDVLCSYINNPNTSYVRRYARRLFLHLCGSKTHYYSVRDSWQFSTEVKKLYKHINKSGGFQSSISYERSVKMVRCLTTMAEVAAARPRNWQKYCLRHGDVLPFLLNGIFYFGEECVVQILKLLNLAFYTGKDSNHSSQKAEVAETGTASIKLGSQAPESKKKKKGEESDSGVEKTQLDMEAVVDVFSGKGDVLRQFIDCFLLEWNSSSVRSEAKSVLLGVWYHGNLAFKETLLTALLQKVNILPMYGQNIIEFTELVTFLLGKVPDHGSKLQCAEVVDKCLTTDVISCIFDTLHSQNELLANHPNSRIYNTLSGLVEFDGYYLESEPCVACSSPEVPYSRMKLESLKSETKFTDNRIIVKCTGSYTIQSVAMNVHDARKSKSVKVLNLYYNNRPVADLSELKNNWSLWKRAKSCHLAFNQTELKVDFAIPITACNFMIELDSFYENLQALSLEPLQCPRCSRAVTDKHGICNNCHENAYQCRQCRNINYENLDSFLCNECGYSKYGRFEFNFMAKPSFTFDSMENDEDMKRGLAAIEAESENAHRRYQQLLGFKKPLLKIVSSVGENEMDSQQKDSVQQMMVSLPGPSCKINRKIALLGVLYGEKCKAAFDSVSKSVQTLQGLRRVLMNYLHQKQSDSASPASRFVVSRVPNSCYGCASTFVTQCLEILQVLSKHPASKKQLVAAGVLSELFENNIHQGPKTARVQARGALCAFSEGDTNAVAELNSLIQKKVMYCLEHHRSMDIALATREELSLLSDVCSLSDEFWESRLRVVFQLLFASIKVGAKHPAISEHVILPCLRIISQACTPPKPDIIDKEQGAGKSSNITPVKDDSSNISGSNSLVSGSKSMSGSSEKSWNGSQKAQDIQLLSYSEWEKGASYLDFVRRQYKVSPAGKSGQRSRLQRNDYLALKYLLRWKRRASKTARNEISSFELGSWVTELILSACSQSIRSEMCMLISLLCGQSSSRRFRLLNLLMSLLSATLSAGENAAEYFELLFKMIDSEDARLFLTVRGCLTTICKLITQELVNVEKLERSLHVDISQGFILHKLIELLGKGSMTKNPYSSAEIGPLMRDVKNKICQQLDLLGLIEDDYGMELLVAGNIISLDLSIAQVFELVWKKSNSQSASVVASTTSLSSNAAVSVRDCPPMTVTYRLQGLDGEATEPMIKEIDEDREETQDPEVEFAIAGAVRDCGGLEILLGMVQRLQDDFKSNREQLVAVLNLLMLCCKIKENRKALLKLGALGLLLETARRAFFVDAMEPAEGILLIVESLTLEANESDNISITSGVDVVSSDEAGAGEQAKKIVLLFLERLSHPSGLRKSNKQQRNTEMVARILPYLTYGEPAAMEALVQHFEPCLQNWREFDRLQKLYEDMKDETIAQQASKQKYTLENFVRVSESLKTSSCGERLKDIILEKGITYAAVSHLKESFAFTGQAGFKSTVEWSSGLKLPSIPLILSMLRGLSMGHLATQKCIDEGGILPLLHALEGVAGENEIGARAENLLDTLSDKEGQGDGFLAQKVHQLRHATRDEMRRRALRKRTELLQGLGMRQELSSDGGERIVVARPILEGLEDVEDEEEEGLACMVCREGYRLRPTDLLGVYTYSKRVNLGVGSSGNARGDCVYTTVSHFNIIHFQCHQEAKRADAALKNPKKEWDGAALRNNETLCNNLFPLRGPSVPIGQYIRYVDQYWDYLNALGRADGSRLRLLTYDIVLMLARFATGASFSADCRGGGKESNARFLPFMMQMARHFLDHDSSQRHIMVKSISTYLSSPASESRASTTAGTQTSAGTEETVQSMMVTSLLSESYESWLQNRSSFLKRGIYHAYIQRTHSRPVPRSSLNPSGALKMESGSTSTSASEAGGSIELFSTIQPMLVYTGLIEQLQRFFKVKKASSATTLRTQGTSKNVEEDDESRKLEGWEVVMKEKLSNVKEMADFSSELLSLEDWEVVMKEKLSNVKEMADFSSELLSWLDDMTSATDFQESFDVLGVLSDALSEFSRCEDYVHAAISGGKN
ncbi:Auxin transport protein BIG [Capsicum baccatum]|uniref:Auxin transport protein BIG n=1 Tax=Capsicum baccatum TaxID=33114 RepID=A0A2G2XHM8_CAPBA|nr:Auxin transport protein BIG [Capsicum baccatum]